MRSRRKGGSAGLALTGLAASALVHVAVVAFLAFGMRQPPTAPESPTVEISLLNLPAPKARPRRATPGPVSPPTQPQVPPPTLAPVPNLGRAPNAVGALIGPTPSQDLPDDVRRALRASVGCDSADAARLSPQERDACRKRLAAMGRDAPTYAVEPADPVKAAAFDRAAATAARHRHEREGPQTNWPCVGAWCPPCQGASCPEPLSSTFAR